MEDLDIGSCLQSFQASDLSFRFQCVWGEEYLDQDCGLFYSFVRSFDCCFLLLLFFFKLNYYQYFNRHHSYVMMPRNNRLCCITQGGGHDVAHDVAL